MPYAVRRRRHEPEHASAERVRLTDAFRAVQHELACCEALMRTDKDASVRSAYAQLVKTLRRDAGGQASEAWSLPAIADDKDMGLQDVHDALREVRDEQQRFEEDAAEVNWLRRRRHLRKVHA